MRWKTLSSEYLHREEWLTIRKDRCEMPDGRIVPEFYVQEYPEWVNAFGVTEDGKVLMVKQYRHGVEAISVELPGGVAEEGESPEEAARREVVEETGYEFDSWEYLGKISANPSTTNNYMHMFLARGGKQTSEQKLDDTEELEVMEVSIEEVKTMMREHKLHQSLHTCNIMYALEKLGELKY